MSATNLIDVLTSMKELLELTLQSNIQKTIDQARLLQKAAAHSSTLSHSEVTLSPSEELVAIADPRIEQMEKALKSLINQEPIDGR